MLKLTRHLFFSTLQRVVLILNAIKLNCFFSIRKEDDDEVTFNPISVSPVSQPPKSVMSNVETPSSVYQPSEGFTTPSGDVFETRSTPKERPNSFLASRDVSPIRYSMITPWDEAVERTKWFHTRKARQVVIAALEEIAPHSADVLLNALQSSKEDERAIDSTLMGVLVECYENAGYWRTQTDSVDHGW